MIKITVYGCDFCGKQLSTPESCLVHEKTCLEKSQRKLDIYTQALLPKKSWSLPEEAKKLLDKIKQVL